MDHFNVSYMNDIRIFNGGRLTRIVKIEIYFGLPRIFKVLHFKSNYFTVLIKLKKCVERVLKT